MGQFSLCCNLKTDIIHNEDLTERRLSFFSQSQNNKDKLQINYDSDRSQNYSMPLVEIEIILKHIKGFLLRKRFNTHLRKSFKEHTDQLVSNYLNKIAYNDLVSQVESNEVNKKYNINECWNEFYTDNPSTNSQIDTNLYQTVHIEYSNSQETSISKSKEKLYNALWLYQGTIDINGKYQGYGVKTYKNGSKEIGNWNNSIFERWNKIITDKGILYIGLYIKGILNGKGIRLSLINNTLLYKGDFVNGLREGKGIETSNSCTYEGEYVKDVKCGKGLLTFTSGDSYEGEFENNTFNGKGHYIWIKNGREYIGEYKEGKFHGQGLYKISGNEYFKGNYVNGMKEGEGEMKYENGKKYTCSFVEGKPNGKGTFENKDGKRITVNFINGKIIKEKRN